MHSPQAPNADWLVVRPTSTSDSDWIILSGTEETQGSHYNTRPRETVCSESGRGLWAGARLEMSGYGVVSVVDANIIFTVYIQPSGHGGGA